MVRSALHVASAHLFGAAATPLGAAIGARCPTSMHDKVQAALESAFTAAQPGDTVLFSPAFASFDQYPLRARALEFHEWLASRRAQGTTAS